MKIAVFTLCVVLPSLYICSPLPDYSVSANSGSSAYAGAPSGGKTTANANSNSSAKAQQGTPAGGPTTVEADAESGASAQQGAPGGPTTVEADAESGASAQQGAPGGPTTVEADAESDASAQQGAPGGPTTVEADAESGASAQQGAPGSGPTTVEADAESGASAQQGAPGGPTTVEADAESGASAQQGAPGGPTTVEADAESDASAQQGGSGGSVDANASSGASASVTVSGNECGKPDCEGFDKCSILVKNQGDIEKLTKVWMVWKTTSTTKINTQETICFPRYMNEGCQSSEFRITVQSQDEIFYESWGRSQEKVIYTKQKLSVTSEKFHVYTSNVLTVTELCNGSQEVVAVKDEQSIKEVFDNNSFGIVDTDFESYVVCTTTGENSVTFIAVSQEVYESEEVRNQVSQKIDQVLQTNNLSSTTFIEVTSEFDIDITKYQWDNPSQGGDNNEEGPENMPTVDNTDIKAEADSSAHASADNNNGKSGDDGKCGDDGKGPGNDDKGPGNGDQGCPGNTGKPDVPGFTNYSVLKISFEEFKARIDKITWHLAKYTASTEEVKTDVTVCADRYIKQGSTCKAVKFQYVVEKDCLVVKEWGLEDTLIYIQEQITSSSQEFVILKAEVVNVMKATKDTDVAVKVSNDCQVKSSLSSEYAILGTDFQNFIVGQTSCDKGAFTFIAYIEEVYLCEGKRQQFAEQITQILKANGIDESNLQNLSQKFDVDTNKYNKKKDQSPGGCPGGEHPPGGCPGGAHPPGGCPGGEHPPGGCPGGAHPPPPPPPQPPQCPNQPPPPQPPQCPNQPPPPPQPPQCPNQPPPQPPQPPQCPNSPPPQPPPPPPPPACPPASVEANASSDANAAANMYG